MLSNVVAMDCLVLQREQPVSCCNTDQNFLHRCIMLSHLHHAVLLQLT